LACTHIHHGTPKSGSARAHIKAILIARLGFRV
jgi:hypothetical protein